MRKTKIICTIGPASESEEKLRELMEEKGIDLLPAMEAGQDEERMDFAAILAFIKAHNEEGGNK